MIGWLKAIGWHASILMAYLAQNLKVRLSYRIDFIVNLATTLLYSLVQVLFFLSVGYCLPGLGLTFPGAMLVFAITALSVAALPLPGYLGVYQGGIKVAALILGLDLAASFNYGWLAWALNIVPIILVGFAFLWKEGLSLGELRRNRRAH